MVMGINIGGKKSERSLKEIDKQLDGIMMITNVNAATVPEEKSGNNSGPLTAIALAAGRLFRPANKEIRAIDEQLSSIIVESEGILQEKPRTAEPPAAKEPVALPSVKVEKVNDYKKALPLVAGTAEPEMKEMIQDVKEFAINYKGNVALTPEVKPAALSPEDEMKASMDMLAEMKRKSGKVLDTKPSLEVKPEPKDPLALDMDMMAKLKESENMAIPAPVEAKADKKDPLALDGDFMAKLRQSSKVEQSTSSGPDIRRSMRNLRVTCDDLENDLAEISLVFKAASARSMPGRKR